MPPFLSGGAPRVIGFSVVLRPVPFVIDRFRFSVQLATEAAKAVEVSPTGSGAYATPLGVGHAASFPLITVSLRMPVPDVLLVEVLVGLFTSSVFRRVLPICEWRAGLALYLERALFARPSAAFVQSSYHDR